MKNIKKSIISVVAVFMCSVMVIGSGSITASADDETATEETAAVEVVTEQTEETSPAEEETAAPETTAAETEPETAAPETTAAETEPETAAPETAAAETEPETTAPETEASGTAEEQASSVSYASDEEYVSAERMLLSSENEAVEVPEISNVSVQTDGIKITWKAVSGASVYRVYRKISGESLWKGYAWVRNGKTTFVDRNISAGNAYSYTLRAIYDNGDVSRYKDPGVTSAEIRSADGWTVTLAQDAYFFNGEALEPAPEVKDGGTVLKEGTDYRVEYSDNVDPGTATLSVEGVGAYRGNRSISFKVKMPTPVMKDVGMDASLIYVTWSAVPGTDFYRIYYREKGTAKWKKLGDTAELAYYTDELLPGATYEFNVRSFHPNGLYSDISVSPSKGVKFNKPVLRKVDDEWWYYGADGKIDYSYYGTFTDEDGTFEIEGGKLVSTLTGDRLDMYWEAQDYTSATNYLILVNRSTHRVGIYYYANGKWEEDRYVWCGDGAYSTPTVEGVFRINHQWYYFDSDNARLFYASNFYGAYWIHSILYEQDNTPQRVLDSRLGMAVSHGCVRLSLDNAKYVFDHCDVGTTVVVYH